MDEPITTDRKMISLEVTGDDLAELERLAFEQSPLMPWNRSETIRWLIRKSASERKVQS